MIIFLDSIFFLKKKERMGEGARERKTRAGGNSQVRRAPAF